MTPIDFRRPGGPERGSGRAQGSSRASSGIPIVPDELQVARRPVQRTGGSEDSGSGRIGRRLRAVAVALFKRDVVVVGALLVLAAVTRFVALPGRGDFDGDQGHDMLTLVRFVRDGQIPLLGPPTSIGDFHHGAAYYFLLAPVAWLSGGDPVAVLAAIAALGTATVGVTWWLASAMGGRVAGALAGLLIAVSPAAIEESTFLWNPNPIPFFAVVALAAAWRGRQTGRARWWALAVGSAGVVGQLHVLGNVFLPPILALAAVDAVRALRADQRERVRSVVTGVGVGIAIIVLLFVPLLIHELQTDFLETRRVGAFLGSRGSDPVGQLDPLASLVFTGLRSIGWPLVGLVTSAPLAAVLTVSTALVLGIWLMVAGRGEERTAARWLGLTVAWSVLALTLLAPSLQTVIAGLPNDHYHAFLDPVVLILVGLTVRAMGSGSGQLVSVDRAARVLLAGAVIGLVAFNVGRWPPATQANGGWPAARDAGVRIVALAPGSSFDVRSLPIFKSAEGIGFPIVHAGGGATIATDVASSRSPLLAGATLVIVCDRLFEDVIGDACGGPAEERYLSRLRGLTAGAAGPVLLERFDASARTSVSVYRP